MPEACCIVCGRWQGAGKRRQPWHESQHVGEDMALPICPACMQRHWPRLAELYGADAKALQARVEGQERLCDGE